MYNAEVKAKQEGKKLWNSTCSTKTKILANISHANKSQTIPGLLGRIFWPVDLSVHFRHVKFNTICCQTSYAGGVPYEKLTFEWNFMKSWPLSRFEACVVLLELPHYNSKQPGYIIIRYSPSDSLHVNTSSVCGNSTSLFAPAMMWWEGKTTRIVCISYLYLCLICISYPYSDCRLECWNA